MLIFLPSLFAQNIRRPKFDTGIDLSQEAAMERWTQFASSRLGGDYCMRFEIKHRPRKGEEIKYVGYMLGAQRGATVFTRVSVAPASRPKNTSDFILKNSPSGSDVWKFSGDKFKKLSQKDWTIPMSEGLLYSPFDLLMPYKFWQPTYTGADRVGQPVHTYRLSSPDLPTRVVLVALTRDFNAPAQIQIYNSDVKTTTAQLGSVKRIDGLWIMREASVKDEISKDKDVLKITEAKFRLMLDFTIFSPDSKRNIEIPQLQKL